MKSSAFAKEFMSYSRTRLRPDEISFQTKQTYSQDIKTGAITAGLTSSQMVASVREEMHDNPTPRFSHLRNKGVIVNTPMRKLVSRVNRYPRGLSVVTGITGTNQGTRSVDTFTCPPPRGFSVPEAVLSEVSRLQTIAITNARAKVAAPDIMSLVSLAELRETFDMLIPPLRAFTGNYKTLLERLEKAYRPGRTLQETLATASDIWLLYRYGITPLMYEIEGFKKIMDHQTQSLRETARGTASKTMTFQSTVPAGVSFPGSTGVSHVHDDIWDINVRAGVLYEHENSMWNSLGLTPGHVLPSAYELITLSFVFDWFVNMNSYLNAVGAELRARSLAQWTTVELTANLTTTRTALFKTTSDVRVEQNPTGAQTFEFYSEKTRAPAAQLLSAPSIRLAMNANRVVDAAALLLATTKIRRKFRI